MAGESAGVVAGQAVMRRPTCGGRWCRGKALRDTRGGWLTLVVPAVTDGGGAAVAGPPWYRLVLATPVSGLTADDHPELGRGGPRWPGVDHAVAIGAEQGEITNVPGAFPANVQRLNVVDFYVSLTA